MRTFKFLLILLLVSYFISHTTYISPAFAQTASPSASLKQKLKALQEEIASKAAQIKLDVGKKLQNRAYIGIIKSKSATSLTLATKNDTKIVTVNEYTEYAGKSTSKQGKVSLKNLSLDDSVVALGDIDDNAVLTAKKVIRYTPSNSEERQMVMGQIVSINDQAVGIKTSQGQNSSLNTDEDTVYQISTKKGSFTDLAVGKTLIAVLTKGESQTVARFIYLYPKTGNLDAKTSSSSADPDSIGAESSPSATPTTTSSAKKKKVNP